MMDEGFEKTYLTATIARESIRRTQLVKSAGIQTPHVVSTLHPRTLIFDRINGESGVGLLSVTTLETLLSPLQQLHRVTHHELATYDPFLRINPRLVEIELPAPLSRLLCNLRKTSVVSRTAIHGDFHLGQVIYGSSGMPWLIDLDDMSSGPPEADLGNLIGHLSTHPKTMRGTLADSVCFWQDRVIKAWRARAVDFSAERVHQFREIAVIRRALKLYEKGDNSLINACTRRALSA